MKETFTLIGSGVAVVLGATAVALELINRKRIKNLEAEIAEINGTSQVAEDFRSEICDVVAEDLDVKIPEEETETN